MQKLTPFLWFDGKAEEAANFYTSVFKHSKIKHVARYPEGAPGPAGTAMLVDFEIEGQGFQAVNGGPYYTITPGISFVIDCADQAEVDYYWDKLLEGGSAQQCGWLTDQFGVSWQVVPKILGQLVGSDDREKAGRAMQAMMGMVKLDVAELQRAYDGD